MNNTPSRLAVFLSVTLASFSSVSHALGTPPSAYGIPEYTGDNQRINNSGAVSITGDGSHSVADIGLSGNNNNLVNSGQLTATAIANNWAYGIYALGNNNSLANLGGIVATVDNGVANGVYSSGDSNAFINTGSIAVTANSGTAYGINDWGSNNSYFLNTGSIAATTNDGTAVGIESWFSSNNTLSNAGSITAIAGDNGGALGMAGFYAFNDTFANSGRISATAGNNGSALGMLAVGAANTFSNSGSITATAGTAGTAAGIVFAGDGNTLFNSGTIIARGGSTANAVDLEGNNNVVNINGGSLLVGNINSGGNGNILNLNLGAGSSYAYQTPGVWSVNDLNNRPFVAQGGMATAAGVGAQETASQMLYQRTASITNALDRRIRDYTSYNQSKTNSPYWIESYYADSSRGAGAMASVQSHFSNWGTGFTAGAKLPVAFMPVEAIVNFEESALNVANGGQTINASSVMTGLLAPKMAEILGLNLSSKAMVGWSGYNGNRTVLTNSLFYNGVQNVTSQYDSVYGVVGGALTHSHAFTDYVRGDILAGFDIDVQSLSSYSESAYFQWNSRTLTQLQSRLQAGLSTSLLNNTLSFFGRAGVEQLDLVSGQAQNYQINGVNVTFNGGRIDNTFVTGQLGSTYDLYKKVQLFGVVTSTNGLGSFQSIQGNVGVKASF